MKLTGLLLIFAVFCTRLKDGYAKSTTQITMNEELLERAALQLGRLSAFRRMSSEPNEKLMTEQPPLLPQGGHTTNDEYRSITSDPQRPEEDIVEAQKRIDELRATASALLQDPRYQAMMQDRIKRSFISGIANKLVGGVVGAASGASRGIAGLSSSNTPSEYGSYGHSYQTKFDIGDFAKAIINTLVQAIKAIGGGAIAGGGALVKGGGYLVSAKGQIISSAGSAITSLGKSIASSAIIASPKPVYGHPGYSYNHPSPQEPSHDLTYDGPPPSEDAYAGPEDAYNAGHSSYAAPSNEDGVDEQAGILIVKETKPGDGLDDHPPTSSIDESNPNLSALEDSFGGPPSKAPSGIITKINGIFNSGQLTVSDQDHRDEQQHHEDDYYSEHKDQQPPSKHLSSVTSYESGSQYNQDADGNYQAYKPDDGQIYDSYGTKLQPYAPQFTASSHTGSSSLQGSDQNHQPLALTPLNTHLEVPKHQAPTTVFKDISSFADYHYGNEQHHSEPLKIPILGNYQNSLDQSHDNQIGSLNYYGSPNYDSTSGGDGGGLPVVHSHIGLDATSSQLSFPDYNNYQLHNGFDQHIRHSSSNLGRPAILGVWGRISRRTNRPVKKAAMTTSKGLDIQRSVGYTLMNAKLTRI